MEYSNKLFLLDAMALIYRSHFALSKNPRFNSKGMNTSAILGFTNSLLEIITKENPAYLAVAFDTSAPTFRHEAFEEYKATRQEQPEDIRIAIPIIKEMLDAFNIPRLELDGYEADDIIGTIAAQMSDDVEVYMMTPDKDYGQLVKPHVFLYRPSYMGSGAEILGVDEVCAKFDIDTPDQVRDILGLQGDSVDNIPGIPGIGAKTAAKLIRQFGSVEELVKNSGQLKGKLKENIENFGEQGLMSKELATIKTDVPVDFDLEKLKRQEPNREPLLQLFEELEFRTIANRVFNEGNQIMPQNSQLGMFDTPVDEVAQSKYKTIDDAEHTYHCVQDDEALNKLIDSLQKAKEICFDTETTSLEPHEAQLVGISFSIEKGVAYYVPFPEKEKETQQLIKKLQPVFSKNDTLFIGQNLKYDVQVLRNYNVHIDGPLFDTMLAHYLIEPESRHSMDLLAENYLGYTPVSIESLIGKKGAKQLNMRNIDIEKVSDYACEDADITLQLKYILDDKLKEQKLDSLFYDVEIPMLRVLADMEYTGVTISKETLAAMSDELAELSREAEKQIYELAGEEFNIASPKQLGEILFGKLQLVDKPKKTKSGQYATGEDILSKLAHEHEIASRILEFREYQKLKSTYVDALPKMISSVDSRVHTEYRQTVAVTGRLSSNKPNLQNIPIRTEKGREIRKAFVASSPDHLIMAADYSQIELRIMAALSGDKSMIAAFREGRDIHATTASKVFQVALEEVESDMRRKAKEVNFGIIYGISAFGLSQNLNIPRGEAADIIESYFKEFPEVKAYMDHLVHLAREQGYVETILGRRRHLGDINSRNATLRGYAERNAINTPIQGSAADMIKVAMVRIFEKMEKEKFASKMVMQVHDELVFDVLNEEKEALENLVVETMKNAIELEVPMEVGIGFGSNWLDAH